jgi:DNA polymerase-1
MFDKKEELPRLRQSSGRPLFAIFEGNYYLHRALATFPSVVTSDGIEVGAVHGLLRMIGSDLKLLRPKYVAVSFDVPGINFRHRISADYKLADPRDPANQSLHRQILIAVRLLRLIGVPTLHLAGVESDDVVGSLATQAMDLCGEDVNTIIFTGDKDINQLVTGRIRTCDTKDKTGWIGTLSTVRTKFGIDPHKIASYLAITGDENDGIAGVTGVGPKKARELLDEFDDVPGILAAAEAGSLTERWAKVLTPTVLANLRRDYQLATILTDLNVGKYGPFVMHTPHVEYLNRALASLEMTQVPPFVRAQLEAAQLASAGSLFGGVSEMPPPLVENSGEWDGLLDKLWDDSVKTHDTLTV